MSHNSITTLRKICAVSLVICLALAAGFTSLPQSTARAAGVHWVCPSGDCGHPGNSYNAIQAAVDASAAGDVIEVMPGDYSETAADKTMFNGGVYTFGLFFPQGKDGLTVQGVDVAGTPITSYSAIQANVMTNATNNFGPSGVFVEGNNITLQGLKIWQNPALGENKTLEIIGDGFQLLHSQITTLAPGGGGSVYFNDWRFDETNNVSYVKSYRIEGSWLDKTSIDLASGTGFSGPVSGRQILNNKIDTLPAGRASISFSGSGTDVPWYVYSVGGAVIQGNTFSNSDQFIRARGTYDNSQFDWAAYWNNNTFDRAVVAGAKPPADLRTFSYTSSSGYTFNNVRRIGGVIQAEVDNAQNGDTVLVKPGVYTEQVTISKKSVTLQGAGVDQTIIQTPPYDQRTRQTRSFNGFTRTIDSVVGVFDAKGVSLSGFTVDGLVQGAPGCVGGERAGGVVFIDSSGTLQDAKIVNVRQADAYFGCQDGAWQGVLAASAQTNGAETVTIQRVSISNFQKNGITVWSDFAGGITANLLNNTITGAGPVSTTAQNGIQISYGAGGTASGNTVQGLSYTGGTWSASSILVYQAATVQLLNNTVKDGQVGVYFAESSGNVDANTITSSKAGSGVDGYYGVLVSDPPGRLPSPSEKIKIARSAPDGHPAGSAQAAVYSVAVTNNTLTGGADSASANGLELDGGYEGGAQDVNVTASNNFIRGWGAGIYLSQCSGAGCASAKVASASLNLNDIENNTSGLVNTTSLKVDASNNWWGSINGPIEAANPGGNGQIISGSAVYNPWLCSGTDAQPAVPGFQPASGQMCTAAPTHLVFTAQPQGGYVNQPFVTQPVVEAQDDQGNLGINFNNPVLLTFGNNPVGGVMLGTTLISAANGVAAFQGLSIDKEGTGYILVAFTDSGLRFATSQPFAILPSSADLSAKLTGSPDPVNAGGALTYQVTVTNHGPTPASSITVTDMLPAGVTLVSAGGNGWTCSQIIGALVCTRETLETGDAPVLTIQVTAPTKPGNLTNTVSVSSQTSDPVSSNNNASVTNLVVFIPVTGQPHMSYIPAIYK